MYNAEAYLERCLGSVLNQDIDDYEVIAINDGSADRSLEMLERTAASHPNGHRLRVLSHANQGVSATRNRGIDEAKGDYIAFVDADDYVEENSLAAIFSRIQGTPDIVFLEVKAISRSGVEMQMLKNDYFYGKLADFIDSPEKLTQMEGPWGKLIKRTAINDIRFETDIKNHEDVCFNHILASFCDDVLALNIHFYTYVPNYESATNKFYGEKMVDWIEHMRTIQLAYYSKTGYIDSLIKQINRRCSFDYMFAMYTVYRAKGVRHKFRWLKFYWDKANKADLNWSYELNSGIPKTVGIIGRHSKLLLHVWLTVIFTAEKLRRKK